MSYKNEIVKIIMSMSGRYSSYDVFSDWIKCTSLAITNSTTLLTGKLWQDREKAYMDTIGKYSRDEAQRFPELLALLKLALQEEMEDVLGWVYMAANMGNKTTGRFFTPFSVSYAMAQLTVPKDIDPEKVYRFAEPSTGGGGMIIAVAKVLQDRGINYRRCMDVVAQDLDWKAVYMSYLQFSLLGIKATVVQGDTLTEPYSRGYPPERVLYTPARKGMLI